MVTDKPVAEATAAEVRAWAKKAGLVVGRRGHLPLEVVAAFNRRHRRKQFTNKNPWQRGVK